MKQKVYIETTVVSYLTAWPSRDLVMAGNQRATRDWWDRRKDAFETYISQAVIDEAQAGDPEAARRRLEVLEPIALLDIAEVVVALAEALVVKLQLPQRAEADALHIAVAAVNGVNYLLTWNCTHIANATNRKGIEAICRAAGFEPPIICTPQELMGNEYGIS